MTVVKRTLAARFCTRLVAAYGIATEILITQSIIAMYSRPAWTFNRSIASLPGGRMLAKEAAPKPDQEGKVHC
jgi:hypothetical protein